jgi:hypothetical protein
MTHVDLIQAQHFLRQQSNWPAKRLRRQALGAALFLLIGGGYALLHANTKQAHHEAPAPTPAYHLLPSAAQTHITHLQEVRRHV